MLPLEEKLPGLNPEGLENSEKGIKTQPVVEEALPVIRPSVVLLPEAALKETVVSINRVSKTVKGGKRFSFGALVVVGDGQGNVGCGLGKSKDIQLAIQKASAQARKNLIRVTLVHDTIPHEVTGKFGAGKVWMKPAAPGTGVISGGGARRVLEAVGVKNILTKSLGSSNHFSVVYATLEALKQLKSKDEIKKLRGK